MPVVEDILSYEDLAEAVYQGLQNAGFNPSYGYDSGSYKDVYLSGVNGFSDKIVVIRCGVDSSDPYFYAYYCNSYNSANGNMAGAVGIIYRGVKLWRSLNINYVGFSSVVVINGSTDRVFAICGGNYANYFVLADFIDKSGKPVTAVFGHGGYSADAWFGAFWKNSQPLRLRLSGCSLTDSAGVVYKTKLCLTDNLNHIVKILDDMLYDGVFGEVFSVDGVLYYGLHNCSVKG